MSAQFQTSERIPFNDRVALLFAAQLRQGDSPLQKNTAQDVPYNAVNGRPFHGANALNLMMQERRDDRWFTFDDARNNGYRIKAGQHGTQVQYKAQSQANDSRTRLQTVYVFNAEQFDRVPPQPRKPPRRDAFERVTELLENSGVKIFHDQKDRSFYASRADEIHMPKPESFASQEKYCATAMYHFFQALGHPNRQDRPTFNPINQTDRTKEDIVCSVATMMYCAEIGIPHDPIRNAENAHALANTAEKHPSEFAGLLRDADTAVWVTLRQERDHNRQINAQESEVWRPIPDASPHKAVETFMNHNRAVSLAEDDPERVYTFQHGENEVFVLPNTGRIIGKSTKEYGDEYLITAQMRSEGFDRDGNTYIVTMEMTGTQYGDEPTEFTPSPIALDIAKVDKAMTMPLDWTGELAVHGCREDAEGNISIVVDGEEQASIEFYGVYAKTADGLEYHLCDYDTEQYADKYASLVEREYTQQTGRELPGRQSRDTFRSNAINTEPSLSPTEEFTTVMKSLGMVVEGEHPIFDKATHRIPVEGDKQGELSGFYVAVRQM